MAMVTTKLSSDTPVLGVCFDSGEASFNAGAVLYSGGLLLIASVALTLVGFPRWLAAWIGLMGVYGLGERLFAGLLADVYMVDLNDVNNAWDVFRNYVDKEWSFTDCTSKAIMESAKITSAFAFDKHFSQFGDVVVVP